MIMPANLEGKMILMMYPLEANAYGTGVCGLITGFYRDLSIYISSILFSLNSPFF